MSPRLIAPLAAMRPDGLAQITFQRGHALLPGGPVAVMRLTRTAISIEKAGTFQRARNAAGGALVGMIFSPIGAAIGAAAGAAIASGAASWQVRADLASGESLLIVIPEKQAKALEQAAERPITT